MSSSWYKKGLVCGVVVLFFGMAFVSSTGSLISDKQVTTTSEVEVTWKTFKVDSEWFVTFTCDSAEGMSDIDRVEIYIDDELMGTIDGSGPDWTFTIKWYEAMESCIFKFVFYPLEGDTSVVIIKGSDIKPQNSSQQSTIAQSSEMVQVTKILKKENKDYTPHSPIVINGNSGFTEENGVTGGSGTEEDPYIIEGWEINGGGYGIRIYHTTSYFILRNCRLTGTYAIEFENVTFGVISTVIAEENEIGAFVISSSNITIQDSIISSDYYSVYLWGSLFCTLSNLTVSDGVSGIFIHGCSNILIDNCDVSNNDYGIDLYKCKNFILKNNNMYSNDYNLEIHGSNPVHFYHDIDTSNMVDGKPVYYFFNQSGLVLSGIEDIGFLGLIKCTSVSVEGLTLDISNRYGILLVETTDSTIASSTISNSAWGIYLFKSSGNTIYDCKTTGAKTIYGIEILHGSSNNILDCEVKGGILIEKSPFNKLRNNTISGNYLNFQVFGNKISHFYQDIDVSNMINGKPIYYYIEEDDLDISGDDIGFLGFVNCSNVNVHDVTIQYVGSGILLVNTDGVVENCELRSCSWGVHLFMCSDVDIIKCNFKNNFCGVYLHFSSFNQVLRCDLSSNWWHGCLLENSDNNSVNRCDVYFTGMDAFFIEDSYDIEMHYNNIAYSGQSGLLARYSSIDATNNWWGHASGPGGPSGPGNGDRLFILGSTVLFEPWLESPRSKWLSYGFSDLLWRLLERFTLLQKLLLFIK